MKKIIMAIVILILILIGVFVFFKKNSEAPEYITQTSDRGDIAQRFPPRAPSTPSPPFWSALRCPARSNSFLSITTPW
jgi:hypothetical protein